MESISQSLRSMTWRQFFFILSIIPEETVLYIVRFLALSIVTLVPLWSQQQHSDSSQAPRFGTAEFWSLIGFMWIVVGGVVKWSLMIWAHACKVQEQNTVLMKQLAESEQVLRAIPPTMQTQANEFVRVESRLAGVESRLAALEIAAR